MDRKEISFLKFIIEAYDGVAVVRTIDSEMGIVALHVSPGCENEVEAVLKELKKEIMIEDVDAIKAGKLEVRRLGNNKAQELLS